MLHIYKAIKLTIPKNGTDCFNLFILCLSAMKIYGVTLRLPPVYAKILRERKTQ
jgi:hypothetical protein